MATWVSAESRCVIASLVNIHPAPTRATAVHDGSRLTRLPILLLNLHTQCNCRCVMCDIWQRKIGQTLSVADLERHRESLRILGVRQVVLTGGEPLLNRELGAICDLLHGLGIRITLLTTGLLLNAKAALVASSIDEIILSLDGPPQVHDAIRRIPRGFETIARGVHAARERRPDLPIAGRTTVQKQNHNQLRATVLAAHSLGLDSISFLAADVWSTAFNHQEPLAPDRQDGIALNPAELVALEAEIDALITTHQADIQTRFIVESEAKLRRIAARFRERLEGTHPSSPVCNAPWVSAVMETDGALRPCFFHPAYTSPAHLTLAEALNTRFAMAFRDQLDVPSNPICQRCVCSLNYQGS
jgi:MoaA/NifB/PqqE/SkfB family radical SAM enzyme